MAHRLKSCGIHLCNGSVPLELVTVLPEPDATILLPLVSDLEERMFASLRVQYVVFHRDHLVRSHVFRFEEFAVVRVFGFVQVFQRERLK